MLSKRLLPGLILALAALPFVARGDWSSDPTTNLPVADAASDQALPKVAPTADGGGYVSWYDGFANGYDVRVQKLDVLGHEVFAHNGVLVANTGFSSVTDYGLDVDIAGNALLAFCDDRPGGTQITAAKVAPNGTLPWGASGVQLTNTADFVASPRIAATSDGGCVVAWTQNTLAKLQRLDANGTPVWGTVVTLTPPAGSYSPSDLHGAGADVVLSFVHQTGSFSSPKHLLAQKLDASGNLRWDAAHVAVFDGGSLQFGNFPSFVADGSGGGVFFWYDAATPQLQCYVQHVLANGTEAFPHNGTAVSTNTTRVRVDPWAAFDAATSETFVFWEEESSTQSQYGLYGQKLDAAGARQWGAAGITLIPLGSTSILGVRTLTGGSGAFVFWSAEPSFQQDRLYGMRLDASGVVDIPTFDVASTPSGKMRLFTAKSTAGFAILAWADARDDDGDIYAQNVNMDGSLGVATAAPAVGASGDFFLSARPNPSGDVVRLDYGAPPARATSLQIVDVQGRVVRHLARGDATRGSVLWDGRDEGGALVAAGVYFARLVSGDEVRTERVARIR